MIDTHLIELCKKRDRAAQKQLYLLSVSRIKSIVWRYCPDQQDAQDVVQSTYLQIFRSIASYDSNKGNFDSWSARIAVNESLQMIRKRRGHIDFDAISDSSSPTVEFNWGAFKVEEVLKVLHKIKEPHKTWIQMHFIDELSYREISEIVKIKESSVRGNVSRAKRTLHEAWSSYNK